MRNEFSAIEPARMPVRIYPELSAKRFLREIRALGYVGGYTRVTDFLRPIRQGARPAFERRFETPPGRQAQVDFAHFGVDFEDEPGATRTVWLFGMVLGHSRWLWGKFTPSQDLQTVMRCHIEAFDALGAAPEEILYDRMKTAVIGEDADGTVIYNASLVALLDHYSVQPRACRPYRAKTKGKIERTFRYVRQDIFAGRRFRNLDDLNARFSAPTHPFIPRNNKNIGDGHQKTETIILKPAENRNQKWGILLRHFRGKLHRH